VTHGSQLQVRLYVNQHPNALTAGVLDQMSDLAGRAESLEWRAPLAPRFEEPRDGAFLAAAGRDDLADSLRRFWPARGPVWDALAVVNLRGGGSGILLCEGKSHPDEIYGGGTKATEPSRARIAEALAETQAWLGVPREPERWMDPLRPSEHGHSSVYQSANRYAHLYWLREKEGVEAWLCHLLFVDDPTYGATSRELWEEKLPQIERDLGLEDRTVPFAGHVFLPRRFRLGVSRQRGSVRSVRQAARGPVAMFSGSAIRSLLCGMP
jgi:hypothetical protein